MPVFSRLFPTIVGAYALQLGFAAYFVPRANEKYYDLGGAVGYLSTTFLSLYYPALRDQVLNRTPSASWPLLAPRQQILTAALCVWAVRLGSFLAQRAIQAGGDSRFDKIKHQPMKFTALWIGQATWISLVGLPVFLVNILPSNIVPALRVRDYASIVVSASSFLFEVVADHQKHTWRKAKDAKQHDEKFITSGLWSLSRHPNYVGEVGIWIGIWALSTAALQTPYFPRGTAAFALVSPLFTWFLLRNASGVPPLERAGDKKWGDDPEWQKYKKTVPIFWPWWHEYN